MKTTLKFSCRSYLPEISMQQPAKQASLSAATTLPSFPMPLSPYPRTFFHSHLCLLPLQPSPSHSPRTLENHSPLFRYQLPTTRNLFTTDATHPPNQIFYTCPIRAYIAFQIVAMLINLWLLVSMIQLLRIMRQLQKEAGLH